MNKLVVLKLDGDFTTGFKVDVEIFLDDKSFDGRKSGQLPAAVKLLQCLESWQVEYKSLGSNQRIKGKGVIITTGNSRSKLNLRGEELRKRFQSWLRAKSFQDVNLWLREKLNVQESIRILLCTNNQKVHQLPWSQWDFLQRYPNAEIALSSFDVVEVFGSSLRKKKSQIKILGIFGSSENLNLKEDLKILNKLKNTYLFPLIKPQREELYNYLWTECWDIVFFAGHSETIEQQGIIYLNEKDVLTIAELEYAFQKAIANGLQLAIFNSCDGLGLAYALGKLGLPQIIVMREPIIDRIAHRFLNYFLSEYSSNLPIHLATRRARERLQGSEQKYPYSSWLPVLYQNQSATPLSWLQLMGVKETSFVNQTKYHYYEFILLIAIASDIIHDFPYSEQLKSIIAQQANFVAICRIKNDNNKIESIAAPPEIPITQTGFTNIAVDDDGVIRRHILGMSPDIQKCQTDMSLSLRMALKYLDYVAVKTSKKPTQQNIYPRKFTKLGNLQIGQTIFPKIEFDSGAYQLPKSENQSYQILLNYRQQQPQSIALRTILAENSSQKLTELVKDKIIFIGVKSHNSDLHYTPYSRGQQLARVPGVFIHAQASSQIISAVLEQRKLLKWFFPKIELLWVILWSGIGASLVLINDLLLRKKNNNWSIFVILLSSILLLYATYFSFLTLGFWLPLYSPFLALVLSGIGSLWIIKKKKKSVNNK